MDNTCRICTKRILSHARTVKCTLCKHNYHCKCISIEESDIRELLSNNEWFCRQCMGNLLPFIHISNDVEFLQCLDHKDYFERNWESNYDRIFNPFTPSEGNDDVFLLDEIDPDNNFYNDMVYHSSLLCKYYLMDEFNQKFKCENDDIFSLLHMNARSLPSHFSEFRRLIESLEVDFTVIGISETWLNNQNSDLFSLPNYNFIENHRRARSGGGVGLYLSENVKYKDRSDLSIVDENMESIFIEIMAESLNVSKNVIIGVVYRPPGTDLKQFSDILSNMLNDIRSEHKMCYLLGDWNINLLNYDSHTLTTNVVDLFYSFGFMPLINRPTRISNTTATIIDNIYTNAYSDLTNSDHGILICDITDHFPIFHINRKVTKAVDEITIKKRFFSSQNKTKFINELTNNDWDYLM